MDCFPRSFGFPKLELEPKIQEIRTCCLTSTGLRKVTAISTGPTDRTKMLCVDVKRQVARTEIWIYGGAFLSSLSEGRASHGRNSQEDVASPIDFHKTSPSQNLDGVQFILRQQN